MTAKVQLVQADGPTSIRVDAEITDEGDLLLSGQDLGAAPQEAFGDSDYEYWLKILAADKDRLLLVVLERDYSGNLSVISDLMTFLKAKGIPYEFASYA